MSSFPIYQTFGLDGTVFTSSFMSTPESNVSSGRVVSESDDSRIVELDGPDFGLFLSVGGLRSRCYMTADQAYENAKANQDGLSWQPHSGPVEDL